MKPRPQAVEGRLAVWSQTARQHRRRTRRTPLGSTQLPSQYLETFGRRVAEEIALAIVEDVAKASGKAGGNLKIPVALQHVGQGLGSLLVVARGVGSALREPFPVAPHVQAPVWSVAHLGHPACMSDIVVKYSDNVNVVASDVGGRLGSRTPAHAERRPQSTRDGSRSSGRATLTTRSSTGCSGACWNATLTTRRPSPSSLAPSPASWSMHVLWRPRREPTAE